MSLITKLSTNQTVVSIMSFVVSCLVRLDDWARRVLFAPAYDLPEALPYQPLVVTHDANQYYVTPLNVRPRIFKKHVSVLAVSASGKDVTPYFKTLAGPYLSFYGQRITPSQVAPEAKSMKVMYTLPEAPFRFLERTFTGKAMYEPMTFQYGLKLGEFLPELYRGLEHLDLAR